MWCFSCLKPSTSEELELDLAIQVSRHEASVQEDAQLALAMEESSRLLQQKEEERRRAQELENDAQIARGFQYEERERRLNNRSASQDEEDEQLARTVDESLKEKDKREQSQEKVKDDEQLAVVVQDSLNMIVPPPNEEHEGIIRRTLSDVDEQLAKALWESLTGKGKRKQFEDEQANMDGHLAATVQEASKKKGKRKQFEDGQDNNDGHLAAIVQENPNIAKSPPRLEEDKNISNSPSLDEDEQRIIWESLKGKSPIKQSKDEVEEDEKLPKVNPTRSMCGGCSSAVERGRSLNVSGVLWHPGCFCCDACDKPIATHEVEKHVSNSRGKFHKSCYQRYCYVCKERKMRSYNQHPFWEDRYCQTHEADGTPKCCSCERLEPRGTNYVRLDDGRRLCLECMESSIMDSYECQHLHFDIREYFEGLNMKIEKEFPFLLVEKQALNKAEEKENIVDNQYEVVTRGICLSETQTITSVSRVPRSGPKKLPIGMDRETQEYNSECEVTAILILYGLPKLLMGYILAHEMMHAYLRLNGYKKLNTVLEEGICQELGYMWLESQTFASADADAAAAAAADAAVASSSSTSRTPPPAETTTTKKDDQTDFEKRLVEFCKYQIETDESRIYGVGFKKVHKMMLANDYNIKETLKQIQRWS